MRGLLYLLAIAGVGAAQGNQTVQALKEPPGPSTTEEALFSVAGGGGYGYPTCQAVTKTKTEWKDKPYTLTVTKPAVTITKPASTITQPGSKETITTTCYETTTLHDTTTSTSTTTCTVVSYYVCICFMSAALLEARSIYSIHH